MRLSCCSTTPKMEADLGSPREASGDLEAALRLDGDPVMAEAYSALALARIGAVKRARTLAPKLPKLRSRTPCCKT
jgi:hypothetical protein